LSTGTRTRLTYNFYIHSRVWPSMSGEFAFCQFCNMAIFDFRILHFAFSSAGSHSFALQPIQLENSYKRFQRMTVWTNDIVTTATTDLRRNQCAQAATARLKHPQVNLLGLGESGEATRRAKCLEAAMLRFVLGNEPSQPQPRGRGTKRKAHTALLRELATQWGGTAGFNPLLCGQGRSIKPCAREPWETNNALL